MKSENNIIYMRYNIARKATILSVKPTVDNIVPMLSNNDFDYRCGLHQNLRLGQLCFFTRGLVEESIPKLGRYISVLGYAPNTILNSLYITIFDHKFASKEN